MRPHAIVFVKRASVSLISPSPCPSKITEKRGPGPHIPLLFPYVSTPGHLLALPPPLKARYVSLLSCTKPPSLFTTCIHNSLSMALVILRGGLPHLFPIAAKCRSMQQHWWGSFLCFLFQSLCGWRLYLLLCSTAPVMAKRLYTTPFACFVPVTLYTMFTQTCISVALRPRGTVAF